MSNSHLNQNDPRLTAFVLGELDQDDHDSIQSHINRCAECAEMVNELRDLSGLLAESLKPELNNTLTPEAKNRIQVALIESIPSLPIQKEAFAKKRTRNRIFTGTVTLASLAILVTWFTLTMTGQKEPEKFALLSRSNHPPEKSNSPTQLITKHNDSYSYIDLKESQSNNNDAIDTNSLPPELVLSFSIENTGNRDMTREIANQVTPTVKPPVEVSFSKRFLHQPIASNGYEGDPYAPGNTVAMITTVEDRINELHLAEEKKDGTIQTNIPVDIDSDQKQAPLKQQLAKNLGFNGNGSQEIHTEKIRSHTAKVKTPAQLEQTRRKNPQDNIIPTLPPRAMGRYYARGYDQSAKDFSLPTKRYIVRDKNATEPVPPSNLKDRSRFGNHNFIDPINNVNRRHDIADNGNIYLYKKPGYQVRTNEIDSVDYGSPHWGSSVNGQVETSNNQFEEIVDNQFQNPKEEPLSTFSVDVDTASYSVMRKFIEQGRLPRPSTIRIEELVNYFDYNDAPPENPENPFACHMETGDCPWETDHKLVRIGIKGKEVPLEKRPPCNLVFLIDVSGSMNKPDKLPLVKSGLEILTRNLNKQDYISIVTYSGEASVKMPPVSGDQKDKILNQIHSLSAKGSTNGEAGLLLAYEQARKNHDEEHLSRVILCTDGDFNVGMSDDEEMTQLIKEQASEGNIFLSVLGFGMGNLKDRKLEKLADNGNGNYAYIDHRREAEKVFHEEINGTLVTIAKDVKVQVEFNPGMVRSYRLIGYANRIMNHQDFNDDTKDAGDIGAGHHVTVLYEIIPQGTPVKTNIDDLKYQTKVEEPKPEQTGSKEWLTCKIRYKQPDGEKSEKLEFPLDPQKIESSTPSEDFYWASAVSSFGMLMRTSPYKGKTNMKLVLELAEKGRGKDPHGRRLEMIDLVRKTDDYLKKHRTVRHKVHTSEEEPNQVRPVPDQDEPSPKIQYRKRVPTPVQPAPENQRPKRSQPIKVIPVPNQQNEYPATPPEK